MTPAYLLVVVGTVLVVAAAGRGRPCGAPRRGRAAPRRSLEHRAPTGALPHGRVPTGRGSWRRADDDADGVADAVSEAGRGEAVADVGVVLELLAVATATASLPDALRVVGDAIGGTAGTGLTTAGAALVLGAGWDEAWSAVVATPAAPRADGRARTGGRRPESALLGIVARCLRPAWEQGAAPAAALRAARDRHDREADARGVEAAERLGVRVVVPLGLCLLPAFVLLGLVPAVIALGTGLL